MYRIVEWQRCKWDCSITYSVRYDATNPLEKSTKQGGLAQLVERPLCMRKVAGSIIQGYLSCNIDSGILQRRYFAFLILSSKDTYLPTHDNLHKYHRMNVHNGRAHQAHSPLQETTLQKQKRFTKRERVIRKPCKLNTRDYIAWVFKMNELLTQFPDATNDNKLPDDELMGHLDLDMSSSWQQAMTLQGF